MRFQPRLGRLLAAASGDLVTVLDVETQVCMLKLQVGCHPSLMIFFTHYSSKTKSSKTSFLLSDCSHFFFLISKR